ncbi:MAG: prevent-host-death protein [Bryobacteraceae bacterium]|jgi:PHD/YefM family antitoxin component YafN of YafNO toxin-antitoxin module
MENAQIQFVCNEAGEPTAVIVPIELWREIESERETIYFLKSETMKQRLLAAKRRQDGLSLDTVVEKLMTRRPLSISPGGSKRTARRPFES